MKKLDVDKILERLEQSSTFHLSLGSKELFHSNFLYWLSIVDWNAFMQVARKLAGVERFWWEEQYKRSDNRDENEIEVRRESRNFDLSIHIRVEQKRDEDNSSFIKSIWIPVFVLENKMKSLPRQDQLQEYTEKAFRDWKIKKKNNELQKKIAEYIKENLELFLTDSFFDDVQDLTSMPVNNQVLQKREGYSQIFNAFTMLDLAKQLDWKGENDVYEGQARNVALLYEYWLVFKFMEILKEIGAEIEFDLSDDDHKDRMFVKENGLLVSLKEGKTSYFSALTKDKKFRIKFYYNRTFGKKDFEGTDYQGSYSRDFRPDYTLAIFPSAYKEDQAIKIGEVSFIHFDAKYRVTDITSLFGKESLDSEDFSEQKKDETINTYKRGDLLKMHTYNDAIRKTIGSYVLYPGTSNKENEFKVYDELLPGVGAFAIRPGDKKNVGAETLKKFISDIIEFKSKDSTRQYRKDYFENSIIRGPGDITSSKYSAVEKKDYVLCGMIRHDYLNHLKANHYIPLSEIDYGYKLKDPESRLYFYYHAINDGAVYSLHPNTNDAKYFCGTVTDLGITSEVSLEKWTAEIEKSELVSAAQLIEALKKNSDYNLENPKADFYYLVTLKNIKWKGLPIADTEQKIEHDIRNLVGSPYSPKVFKLDKNM